MTNSFQRAATLLVAGLLSSGVLAVSAGCTATDASPGTGTGGERVAAPTAQTSVTPTPRPAGAVPASPPMVTARPAELPSATQQPSMPSRLVVRTGSVVLGGHLDSREFGTGPLVRLRKVRRGDVVEVRSAVGAVVRYRVVEIRDIPKKRLAVDGLFDRAGPRRLQLVTCGGPYDADNGGYRDNSVVTADAMP